MEKVGINEKLYEENLEMNSIQAVAQLIEVIIDDEDGLSSFFVKWGVSGVSGQYISIAREDGNENVYCELFDQVNGSEFNPSLLRFYYSNKTLVFEVAPPETFVKGLEKRSIEIDLSGVQFDENELVACLKHLFR